MPAKTIPNVVDHSRHGSEAAPEPVRALVTFAVAVYIFALVLGILARSSSGASLLVGTLNARLFEPLLGPAWLDQGFDYPFTYGLPDDADLTLELRSFGRPDSARRFPDTLAGERARRWRRLARGIAETGPNGDGAAALAAGAGAAAFDELGSDVTVRVLRRARAGVGLPDPGRIEEAFEARVREVGGEVQLIRQEAAGELAPLAERGAAAGPSARPGP